MKVKILIYLAVVALTSASCSSRNKLTKDEKELCDRLLIDPKIVEYVREKNDSPLESFQTAASKLAGNDRDTIISGLVFTEKNSKSHDLIFTLKDNFNKKGYSIFLLDNNFDIEKKPDAIAVLKTNDEYRVLKAVGTNGINYDIINDSLITIIKQFDKQYSLELVGAGGDWCEFVIHDEPEDWKVLANEVYKVCPDVVDQGTGSVEELAVEMEKTHRLYFWWD